MAEEPTTREKIDPKLQMPDTSVPEPQTSISENIAFEKFKIRMNFYKWMMGTFCIAIITIAINWSFNDRAVGMDELSAYEKYTTEVMVLNENPVKKRMLAQFFGTAAPSFLIRKRWKAYYDSVNKEYNVYLDSTRVFKEHYKKIINKKEEDRTDWDKMQMEYYKDKLDLYQKQEAATVTTPQNALSQKTTDGVVNNNKSLALEYEKDGFKALLAKDYENTIKNFQSSLQLYPELHNVSEIYKLLINQKPAKPQDWIEKYRIILKDLSWGMPEDARKEMQRQTKK